MYLLLTFLVAVSLPPLIILIQSAFNLMRLMFVSETFYTFDDEVKPKEKVKEKEKLNYADKYKRQLVERQEQEQEQEIDEEKEKEQEQEKEQPKVNNTRLVMDFTPQGNVLMSYNTDKESFEYFSDRTIPYAFLLTVARKYVLCFDCLSLLPEGNIRFTHMGKLMNAELLQYQQYQQKTSKVSYSDYKLKSVL
jgi:hypothetical protein